jgi:hypothetical protein
MHHCNTDKDSIEKDNIQKYNIYSSKFKSNSDIVKYIYNSYNFTYNNDGKEKGRSKSCIRFYGDANSRVNQGKRENGNENKNLLTNNTNQSTAMRFANTIKTNGSGKGTQFGHVYTTKQRLVTYLGTTEGQPGGSGAPPRNKF